MLALSQMLLEAAGMMQEQELKVSLDGAQQQHPVRSFGEFASLAGC